MFFFCARGYPPFLCLVQCQKIIATYNVCHFAVVCVEKYSTDLLYHSGTNLNKTFLLLYKEDEETARGRGRLRVVREAVGAFRFNIKLP